LAGIAGWITEVTSWNYSAPAGGNTRPAKVLNSYGNFMGALILIIPTLAFDVWLAATVGKRLVQRWIHARAWPRLAAVCGAGLALGVCCLLAVQYQWDPKTRVVGFPIPLIFFNLEDQTWVRSPAPRPWLYLGAATNLITGIALPLVPYKIGEFFKTVKRELNRCDPKV
jgi:hypothetical protein